MEKSNEVKMQRTAILCPANAISVIFWKTFRLSLILIGLLFGVGTMVNAQFQYTYQFTPTTPSNRFDINTPHMGEIQEVINIFPGGTMDPAGSLGDNQYATIGTALDFRDLVEIGVLSWYDQGGVPILYRPIKSRFSPPVPIEGIDLCESTYNDNTLVAVFEEHDNANEDALVIYINKFGYLRDRQLHLRDFDPHVIISEDITTYGPGIFLLGVDRRNFANDISLISLDDMGNIVWSFNYEIMAANGVPLDSYDELDIEYIPDQGFVIVGSGFDSTVGRQTAFILNLEDDGTIIPDNPVAGIRGAHFYQSSNTLGDLWLGGVTVTPTRIVSLPAEVVVAGNFGLTNGMQDMYIMRVNPLTGTPVWDLVPQPGNPIFQGVFFPQDMDFNGGEYYQLSGFVENSREHGFTFHFEGHSGNPIGLYEYDANVNAPSFDSKLYGNHFDSRLDRFIVGGTYHKTMIRTPFDGENWLLQTANFTDGAIGDCDDIEAPPPFYSPNIVATPAFATATSTTPTLVGRAITYGTAADDTFEQCISRAPTPEVIDHTEPGKKVVKLTYLPYSEAVHIHMNLHENIEVVGMKLYNASGQIIWEGEADTNEISLPISGYPSGIYLLSWKLSDGSYGVEKIPAIK